MKPENLKGTLMVGYGWKKTDDTTGVGQKSKPKRLILDNEYNSEANVNNPHSTLYFA